MDNLGIKDVKEVIYNPSYDEFYEVELDPSLEGFEKGCLTELGAVNVMTGIFTGRSPKDKYIVKDDTTKDTIGGHLKALMIINLQHKLFGMI